MPNPGDKRPSMHLRLLALLPLLVVAMVLLLAVSSSLMVSGHALGAPSTQLPDKQESKISPLLRQAVEDVFARGLTNSNLGTIDVSSLSVKGLLKVDANGNIQTYIYVNDVGLAQLQELENYGVSAELVNDDLNIIQGWVPFFEMKQVAQLELVQRINPPSYAYPRTGSTISEGDAILGAAQVRSQLGFTGAGVNMGVISDGVDSRATAQASGDLPVTIEIDPSQPGSGDEGTAMLEIIHDLAPGAALAFSGPSTSLEMINAVNFLANTAFGGAGADIVVDDLGFFGEPFFEDGPIALAVQAVVAAGTIYVSAAGNDANSHYEADFVTGSIGGFDFHDFGSGDNAMSVTVAGNGAISIVLQWNDPFSASGNDYDLFACNPGDNPVDNICPGNSFDAQNGDDDPFEFIFLINLSPSPASLDIFIHRFSGQTRRLEMFVLGSAVVNEFNVPAGSIFGHPAVPGAIAVGAIDAADPGVDTIEPFSSHGPAEITFPSFESRLKPDVVGIDGVSVTGAGGFLSPFFGTSAAAPHVAAVAALVLEALREAQPGLTKSAAASQIFTTLQDTAVDLGVGGLDQVFGAGRVDALAAAPDADLAIAKSDSPDPVALGGDLTYIITVTNSGPDAATSVVMSDTVLGLFNFGSASASQGSCSGSDTVTCELGTIANGANATVTIVVSPTTVGTLSNTASVTGNVIDPNTGNNTATEETTVNPPTLQSLAVSPSDATVLVAGTLHLTATGTFSDASTQDLTATVTWASSDPAVATISSSGLASGVGEGTVTITATDPATSLSGTATLTVVIPAAIPSLSQWGLIAMAGLFAVVVLMGIGLQARTRRTAG